MTRIGIVGYGNLGKGVEAAISKANDMELKAVFTRRNPDNVNIKTPNVNVYSLDDAANYKNDIDVMIVCGGSATDLPTMTPAIAKDFNVIDSFDTHARIPEHFANVDAAAKAAGKTALISCGWDPGMFSLNRLYANSILLDGKDYTFWGKGVSQGHSDAVRRIDGVKDCRQYTCPVEEAMDALWKAILKVTRVGGDPIQNWKEHDENLNQKTTWLNSLGIKTLTYKSSIGTDFTVDIDERLTFMAGGESTRSGIYFQPNMPTEECFTSPIKTSANGVVYATKPLSIRGVLAHDFGFRFNEGKVVEVLANDPVTKEVLENLVATDEGSAMLGEVALVPYDSPINQTGILFYNTLYDENACCHLALGMGFEDTVCEVEMAYFLDEEYQGHGYATEALIALFDWCMEVSDLKYMILTIDCANEASCKVAERAGFELFEKRTPINHKQPNMVSDSYYYYRKYNSRNRKKFR